MFLKVYESTINIQANMSGKSERSLHPDESPFSKLILARWKSKMHWGKAQAWTSLPLDFYRKFVSLFHSSIQHTKKRFHDSENDTRWRNNTRTNWTSTECPTPAVSKVNTKRLACIWNKWSSGSAVSRRILQNPSNRFTHEHADNSEQRAFSW